REMIKNTKSPEYRDELSKFAQQVGEMTLALLAASLAASKSPFDSTITPKVVETSNSIKTLLVNIIRVTVEHNKGKGGENSQYKEDFIFSIKVCHNTSSTELHRV